MHTSSTPFITPHARLRLLSPPNPNRTKPNHNPTTSTRADAAEALRLASRRVADAEQRAAALSGDVEALSAELGGRPTNQDVA